MDEAAELGEEDDAKIKKTMKKINEFIRYFKILPETFYNIHIQRLHGTDHWAKRAGELDETFSNRLYCVIPGDFYESAKTWFSQICQQKDFYFVDVRKTIELAYTDPEFSLSLKNEYAILGTQEHRYLEKHYSPSLLIKIIQK